jgi:hypothetical protein
MRKVFVLLCLAGLLTVYGCNDSDGPAGPVEPTPTVPDGPTYSIIGYWQAIECEGQGIEQDPYAHGVSLRRDRTFAEYDSAGSLVVIQGTYRYADGELRLTPAEGSFQSTAVWTCQVSADTMTWCRCPSESPAAWVFVRSTRE